MGFRLDEDPLGQKDGALGANLVEQLAESREVSVQWVKPRVDTVDIIELYVNSKLSAKETGRRLGISKTAVLNRINGRRPRKT